MKVVFFGTSLFAARLLTFLIQKGIMPVAIVTRPDQPKGRALHLESPPVKQVAPSSIPLYQPQKASTQEFSEILKGYQADLFVVVAYGEILKENLLFLPRYGSINVHASLLPEYRGAAPMQRALMDGVERAGVTIIDMVLQMDAGDILKQADFPVSKEMNLGELEEKMYQVSGPLLLQVIQELEQGRVNRTVQDPLKVTYAAKISPEERQIHWEKPAQEVHNLIRAFAPAPGAWCLVSSSGVSKRLKILKALPVSHIQASAGTCVSWDKENWVVACGQGGLCLLEVQLEGKKRMSAREFLTGGRLIFLP